MKIKSTIALSIMMVISSMITAKPAAAVQKAAFVACGTALGYWSYESCALVPSDGQGGLVVASCNNHLIIYNRNCFDAL